MKVTIKHFDVDMHIKTKGIEMGVFDPNGKHRGDLVITKTKLIWCDGRKTRENGEPISWDEFIKYMLGRATPPKGK